MREVRGREKYMRKRRRLKERIGQMKREDEIRRRRAHYCLLS